MNWYQWMNRNNNRHLDEFMNDMCMIRNESFYYKIIRLIYKKKILFLFVLVGVVISNETKYGLFSFVCEHRTRADWTDSLQPPVRVRVSGVAVACTLNQTDVWVDVWYHWPFYISSNSALPKGRHHNYSSFSCITYIHMFVRTSIKIYIYTDKCKNIWKCGWEILFSKFTSLHSIPIPFQCMSNVVWWW